MEIVGKVEKNCDQYANKVIMAPMVRIGTLPARLLALRNGADLVYSEEIIDWRLLKSKRIINDVLGTIDYIDESDGSIVFRTCPEEKTRVILQIGTSDPERALSVGLKICEDVAGIDVNMGCPKDFSLKGGMGAALLTQPHKIKAILTTLVQNIPLPITCKIRVLSTAEATIELCKLIESTGVSAIGVHGRNVKERPQHRNQNEHIKQVAQSIAIPIIANGGSREIERHEDIGKFRKDTGASSVMLARAIEWNSFVLSSEGKVEMHKRIKEYLKLAITFDNPFPNTKYNIQNILRDQQDTPLGHKFLETQTMEELCGLWDLKEFYNGKQTEFAGRTENFKRKCSLEDENSKKIKVNNNDDSYQGTIVPNCDFIRGHYKDVEHLPKSILFKWSRLKKLSKDPQYTTQVLDKKFRSTVNVGGKIFSTDLWEKNKKFAEQAAALACIQFLGINK